MWQFFFYCPKSNLHQHFAKPASHFSIAASFFSDVSVVAVVGGDFTEEEQGVFEERGVGIADLERIPDGKTFRWEARYDYDLNVAHTLCTELNVFATFKPKLSEASKKSRLLFLGNIQPDLQREVREQMPNAELVALDTMNLWIENTRDSLPGVLRTSSCCSFCLRYLPTNCPSGPNRTAVLKRSAP